MNIPRIRGKGKFIKISGYVMKGRVKKKRSVGEESMNVVGHACTFSFFVVLQK